jgi:DNA repair protein RecN (Recombination protein N)
LAQLAGYGEQHYRVSKKLEDERTITYVENLNGEDRLMELAQMLGDVSAGTLQSASEILQSVNETVGIENE